MPEVRVFMAKDLYFNGPFLDESQWVCFAHGLAGNEGAPAGGAGVAARLLQGRIAQAKAMERIFTAGGRMNRATLEIRKTEGADPRQFEITRVLVGGLGAPAEAVRRAVQLTQKTAPFSWEGHGLERIRLAGVSRRRIPRAARHRGSRNPLRRFA